MPGLLDKAVSRIKATGVPASRAWPMAIASQQRAGNLKAGTTQLTKQGQRRSRMTASQRRNNPPGGQ